MLGTQVTDWLLQEGRLHRNHSELTAAFAEKCLEAGIPLSRSLVAFLVLSPKEVSYLLRWGRNESVEEVSISAEDYPEMLRTSPLFPLAQDAKRVRYRLCDEASFNIDILNELKAQGHTDYIAHLLPAEDRTRSRAIVYVTDQANGFTEEQVEALEQIRPVLALVTEVHAQAQRIRTLLSTYIGPKTGQQVIEGKIKRGDGANIEAVVWFCDLRNFTPLSEELSGPELLRLLNDFFEVTSEAIEKQGGEVLKFIGDALLAIFPLASEEPPSDSAVQPSPCKRALSAVTEVQQKISTINEQRTSPGSTKIDYGIALHIGEVYYGNIGGKNRLDFTVIGPAVNLTSRIESKTKELGQKLLVSEAFYDTSPDNLEFCAEMNLKGMSAPQKLYQLASSAGLK